MTARALDTSPAAEAARDALLACARQAWSDYFNQRRPRLSADEILADEIAFHLCMGHTEKGRALRWARTQARRRARGRS